MSEPKIIEVADPFSGALTKPCPHCGRSVLTNAGKWALWEITPSENGIECSVNAELDGIPEECDCGGAAAAREQMKKAAEEKAEQERQAAWAAEFESARISANLPPVWVSRSLSAWRRDTNARETAWNAVKNAGGVICGTSTQNETKRGICLIGGVGTGKTFLASCFAVSLLRRNVGVRWCSFSEFVRCVRASFSRGCSEQEVLDKFTSPTVLFIDDLGKERPTDWAVSQLFTVIDARYNAELPTVISSNYSLQELVIRLTPPPDATGYADDTTAQSIVDRIRAMCEIVVLDGKSQR